MQRLYALLVPCEFGRIDYGTAEVLPRADLHTTVRLVHAVAQRFGK